MNFDIKYATYLQIFNFIKIKQGLGTILGIQSWGSNTKLQTKLGTSWVHLKSSLVNGAHLSVTEIKRKRKRERAQVHHCGLSLNLTIRPHFQRPWSIRNKSIQETKY